MVGTTDISAAAFCIPILRRCQPAYLEAYLRLSFSHEWDWYICGK